jgi:hypothetical protein
MATVKAGRIIPVSNKDAHHRAAASYNCIWVEDQDGTNERCLLITQRELHRIERRSQKNLEDWTDKRLFTDLFD